MLNFEPSMPSPVGGAREPDVPGDREMCRYLLPRVDSNHQPFG